MYFVYVGSSIGPEPQKWPELLRGSNNQNKPHLAAHKLRDHECTLPIDVLMKIYPAPKEGYES